MKAHEVGGAENFFLGDSQRWPEPVIVRVLKRNQCVEAIIAACQLNQDEDAAVLLRCRRRGERRLDEELRGELTEREEADALGGKVKEFATCCRKVRSLGVRGHGVRLTKLIFGRLQE